MLKIITIMSFTREMKNDLHHFRKTQKVQKCTSLLVNSSYDIKKRKSANCKTRGGDGKKTDILCLKGDTIINHIFYWRILV